MKCLLIILLLVGLLSGCKLHAVRNYSDEIKPASKIVKSNLPVKTNSQVTAKKNSVARDTQMAVKNIKPAISEKKRQPIIIKPETETQKRIRLMRKKLKTSDK